METKLKTKRQIVNSIKDSLFYVSPEDIILWLENDEYEFLCREVFDEKK